MDQTDQDRSEGGSPEPGRHVSDGGDSGKRGAMGRDAVSTDQIFDESTWIAPEPRPFSAEIWGETLVPWLES